jgi:hypothetical protein
VPNCAELSLDTIAARSGLVAKTQPPSSTGHLLGQRLQGGRCIGNLAVLAHFSPQARFGHRDRNGIRRTIQRNPRKPAYCETGRPGLKRTSGLVGALCVAVALDGATTVAPPDVVAHVLAARLLATDETVPVFLLLDAAETVGEPRNRRPSLLVWREGARPRPLLGEAGAVGSALRLIGCLQWSIGKQLRRITTLTRRHWPGCYVTCASSPPESALFGQNYTRCSPETGATRLTICRLSRICAGWSGAEAHAREAGHRTVYHLCRP